MVVFRLFVCGTIGPLPATCVKSNFSIVLILRLDGLEVQVTIRWS